ncbi:MAG: glycosyltransferase family 39 protein [Victivallales bacterium]|nr:glycosyltransferase family 39 protein [Victivallales bacterium]
MQEKSEKNDTTVPSNEGKGFSSEKLYLACIVGLLLIRIFPFANGNYLFDEAFNLDIYILAKDSIWGIMRDYSMANNHILSSILYWFWVSLMGDQNLIYELLVRVPSILWSIGTILVAYYGWRAFLGRKQAFLAALLMAISPVFSGFAWQLRGYSLTVFLSAWLVALSLRHLQRQTVSGRILLFACSLLLPLVMPSAFMMPAAVGLAIFVTRWRCTGKFMDGVLSMLPVFCGVVLGGGYYLTLGPQFVNAARAAGGWDSFWATFFNIFGSFLLHCGIFSLAIPELFRNAWQTLVPRKKTNEASHAPDDALAVYPSLLFVSVVLTIMALLLGRNPIYKYPFPRVFLLMLPPITFAVLSVPLTWKRFSFRGQVAVAFLLAVAINACCDYYVRRAGSNQNIPCQNLLVQRWRGSSELFDVSSFVLKECKETGEAITLLDSALVPSVSFYCRCYNYAALASTFPAIMAPDWFDQTMLNAVFQKHEKLKILAQTEQEAQNILQRISHEHPASLSPRMQYGHWTYYEINFH